MVVDQKDQERDSTRLNFTRPESQEKEEAQTVAVSNQKMRSKAVAEFSRLEYIDFEMLEKWMGEGAQQFEVCISTMNSIPHVQI